MCDVIAIALPLERNGAGDIALEVMNRKGWAHDPDLLEIIADKIKDVRKRLVS